MLCFKPVWQNVYTLTGRLEINNCCSIRAVQMAVPELTEYITRYKNLVDVKYEKRIESEIHGHDKRQNLKNKNPYEGSSQAVKQIA